MKKNKSPFRFGYFLNIRPELDDVRSSQYLLPRIIFFFFFFLHNTLTCRNYRHEFPRRYDDDVRSQTGDGYGHQRSRRLSYPDRGPVFEKIYAVWTIGEQQQKKTDSKIPKNSKFKFKFKKKKKIGVNGFPGVHVSDDGDTEVKTDRTVGRRGIHCARPSV